MPTKPVRILLVENDPEISDLVARQILEPLGHQVFVTQTVAEALEAVPNFSPDIIISALQLPDLSGKDLLAALNAQGVGAPMIVLAVKGMEADLISALRLGAVDYCMLPIREVEMITVVDKGIKLISEKRENELMAQKLKQANIELQQRIRELTTIISIGKAVTSITDQKSLLDKIVEGVIYVSSADLGWLLLKQEHTKAFLLAAQRNLPHALADQIGKPWDDDITRLVATSGEPLSIHGDPIRKFKISQLGHSALIVPVKIKKEIIGLLVVMHKQPKPFTSSNITLVEAVADYASISLANALLYKSLIQHRKS